MKKILLLILIAIPAATNASVCSEIFYGTVNYTDLNDRKQSVSRQEIFRFHEWSPQEQFDQVLVKKSGQIPERGSLKATIRFSALKDEKQNSKSTDDVIHMTELRDWVSNKSYYVVDGIDFKKIMRKESRRAARFTIVIEKDQGLVCECTFPIYRGD